jgi:dolichol kinase
VQQTHGLQPWRKVFHAFNGLVIAGGLTFFHMERAPALVILGGITLTLLVWDVVRLRHRGANELFFRSFSSLVSPREAAGFASSTWYMLGVLVVVSLLDRPDAVSAILVLGLADPVASVVGQTFGRRPFLGGTVEGTAVFLAVALTILMIRHAWPAALAAATLAALAERRSWPLDDNFTVPVVTGITLWGVGALL